MFDLIDRLERLGPSGAPLAVGIGLILAVVATTLAIYSITNDVGISRYSVLGLRGLAFFTLAMATVFGMVGVRLRTGPSYPDPADVFPSLPVAEFKAAMYAGERPLAACSACLIHLPAQFSTGACPRCSSSLGWHHIENDEDAELICSAVVS